MHTSNRSDGDELVILRVSLARIAQSMGVDNHLQVLSKEYRGLTELAIKQRRGWNDLCGRIQEHAERLQQDNEDLRRQYHECEANASREEMYEF